MGILSCFTADRRKSSSSRPRNPSPENAALKVADCVVYTKTINGHSIAFTDFGFANDGPAIVTFSGWNQDHRGWANVTPYLMDTFRVISVCFRGHGPNRDPVQDFGFEDHARDVLGVLDSLGVDQFVCMAASHGTWPALELSQMVGRQRCLAVLILDLIMSEASPQFLAGLRALQGKDTWRPAVMAFFKGWSNGTQNVNMREQMLLNAGGFNHETWSRAGRTIEAAYVTWGSPLKRMEDGSSSGTLAASSSTVPVAVAAFMQNRDLFCRRCSDWVYSSVSLDITATETVLLEIR
ncbi:1H-3-hydroxy-4-oxoquinaldine 2,4-dioxygenase [Cytospora mali]|uniref:1H-3-hydroxy-4-oxoquinaldine 2,4-dioxygenase n=1 Tax=Cytospora mali TaxID=578113 RepID=A0A194VHD7_CYTMA|nr:1H-3-hydroxy-4-oxoquinaldine 2,4-dioxygenase [Valsa mali var. pyri (nom. inval.)]